MGQPHLTFLHVYVFGFAFSMMLFAWAFFPYRKHRTIRNDWLPWTLTAIVASACWPLVLVALIVAATDR